MSKFRVTFRLIVEGNMEFDIDDDQCPLHEFSSASDETLVDWVRSEFYHNKRSPQVEIDSMEAECLDHPLVQLARQADDESR